MQKPRLIAPNIYLLPAFKPASNCYLMTGKKNTLIDVGIREQFEGLSTQLNSLELTMKDIHHVIYTHCHYDHTGGGEFFPHAEVYAHTLCDMKLRYQDEMCIHALTYQIALPSRLPDIILKDGDIYSNGTYDLNVIHTPGHTDDSICLFEPQHQILFSGDTIYAKGIPSLITDSGSDASLIYSVETLQQLPLKMIFPGHGRIETSPKEGLETTKHNIIKRIQKNNKKIIEEAKTWLSTKY